jgi:hypothetical protein
MKEITLKGGSIRTKPWYKNEKNLSFDQGILEETVRTCSLTKCPICKGKLKREDNFGTSLPGSDRNVSRYCPNENYILTLMAHQYRGNGGAGTEFYLEIYTNSKFSKLIADSGELADTKEEVTLDYFS